MRALICILFVLTLQKSFGQIKEASQNAVFRDPIYFLDSVKINKNQMFFDLDKIAAINVVKSDGEIYITSKNPKSFNFLTLNEIAKPYLKSKNGSVLFMIDNKILKDDIATYRIDSTYVLSVEILKSIEIESLKNSLPNFAVINIQLKTKKNMAKAKEVFVKGVDVATKPYN